MIPRSYPLHRRHSTLPRELWGRQTLERFVPGRILLPLLLSLLLVAVPAWAQEEPREIPYNAEVVPTEDEQLNEAAAAVSQLIQLEERAPATAFGLVARARQDIERLQTALQSEGYYAGEVRIEIAGLPADTPGLEERLEAAQEPVPVRIILNPGPQYRLSELNILPEPPTTAPVLARALEGMELGIAPGDPARAGPILDARDLLLEQLRQAGYPLASVARSDAVIDRDLRTLEVTWAVAPGPQARFAPPQVVGQTRTETGLLERVVGRRLTGEIYSPEKVEEARRALSALGVFSTVRVRTAEELNAEGRLPVTFVVTERPLRLLGFAVEYDNAFGPTGRVYWEHRNLFGGAERLRLEAEVARLGTEGIEPGEITYRAFATLRTPEVWGRNVQMVARLGAVRERLEAFDRDAILATVLLERRFSESVYLQAGPAFETGEIGRFGDFDPFTLLGFTFGGRVDTTLNLLDPRRGYRLNATVTPWWAVAGEGSSFIRALVVGTFYRDLSGGEGRTVLALRGALGSAPGASRDEIPLDKRFYAGGGGSVRGFDFQSIGPRDTFLKPLGGASLVEGSVELRQRVTETFGAVVFMDAGTVGVDAIPDFADVRVGVGVGIRYLTAIGPLRADIAVPLNREPGDTGYGIYVGLGQAF